MPEDEADPADADRIASLHADRVLRVQDADEAFRINNGVKYGLSSSLYTRDVNLSFRAMNELDNGITYISELLLHFAPKFKNVIAAK